MINVAGATTRLFAAAAVLAWGRFSGSAHKWAQPPASHVQSRLRCFMAVLPAIKDWVLIPPNILLDAVQVSR